METSKRVRMHQLDSLSGTYLEIVGKDDLDSMPPLLDVLDPKKFELSYGSLYQKGDILQDLYEIKNLAIGGMGVVYFIWHRLWGVHLAMKSPKREIWEDKRKYARYLEEAQIWTKLGLHPNVVSSYYIRELDGIPRIFSEYVDGGSLKKWINERILYQGDPEQTLDTILDFAIQTAWGLEYAHESGVVHQDIKPENILISSDFSAKVTDFGLASSWLYPRGNQALESGVFHHVGFAGLTKLYCSPEQLARQSLSLKTDMWSWAVTVLEMFSGRCSWENGAQAGEALERYLHQGITTGEHRPIPLSIIELLRHCFEKDPERRPANMNMVADLLLETYKKEIGRPYLRSQPHKIDLLADELNNKGLSLLDLNQKSEAEQMFEKAIKIVKAHPEATFNRGLMLWHDGKITDVQFVQMLEESRSVHTNNWRINYYLALAHIERGDTKGADAALGRISRTNQDEAEVIRCRDVIQQEQAHWGQCLHVLRGHKDGVTSLAMTPDGKFGLSEDRINEKRLWDLVAGSCLGKLEENKARGVLETPDKKYWIDNRSEIWNQVNHSLGVLRKTNASSDGRLRLLPNNAMLNVGTVRVLLMNDWQFQIPDEFDGNYEELVWQQHIHVPVLRSFEGHLDVIQCCAISADGLTGITGSRDFTVRVWMLRPGLVSPYALVRPKTAIELSKQSENFKETLQQAEEMSETAPPAEVIQICYKARSMAGHEHSPEVMAIIHRIARNASRSSLRAAWLVQNYSGHKGAVCSLSVGQDDVHALSGDWEKRMCYWNFATGECLWYTDAHQARVEGVSLSPDGRFGLSAADSLRMWDLQSGKLMHDFNTGATKSVSFSKNGGFAASAHGTSIRLWDLNTYECKHNFEGHSRNVNCVVLTDEFLLSGSDDKTIRLWNLENGICQHRFIGHSGSIESLALTLDGRFIFSAGGGVRLWERSSGKCLSVMTGHTGTIWSVAVSPDGRFGVTASMDQTLRLWRLINGQCLREFKVDESPVQSVAFLNDGFQMLSGSFDHSIKLWELDWTYEFDKRIL